MHANPVMKVAARKAAASGISYKSSPRVISGHLRSSCHLGSFLQGMPGDDCVRRVLHADCVHRVLMSTSVSTTFLGHFFGVHDWDTPLRLQIDSAFAVPPALHELKDGRWHSLIQPWRRRISELRVTCPPSFLCRGPNFPRACFLGTHHAPCKRVKNGKTIEAIEGHL
jgi:hypothetical protein